jgi:hypothetical protein
LPPLLFFLGLGLANQGVELLGDLIKLFQYVLARF